MIRKLIYLLFVPLSFISLKAQNLVPNGSFEEYKDIDTASNFISIANCQHWITATGGTPDYFSATLVDSNSAVYIPSNVGGYQYAKNGNFYVGIFTFNKLDPESIEYIQAPLVSELLPQKKYCISFYVSLAEKFAWYTVNNIGVYISENSIATAQNGRLDNYTPQIINPSTNPLTSLTDWMLISCEYFAQGGEKYLTIGNFNTPDNQDTVYVGSGFNWDSQKRGYIYIDSVSVRLCDATGIEETKLEIAKVFPNPANDILNVYIGKLSQAEIELFDISGRKLLQQKLTSNQVQINISSYSNGLYFVRLSNNKGEVIVKKVSISH